MDFVVTYDYNTYIRIRNALEYRNNTENISLPP